MNRQDVSKVLKEALDRAIRKEAERLAWVSRHPHRITIPDKIREMEAREMRPPDLRTDYLERALHKVSETIYARMLGTGGTK